MASMDFEVMTSQETYLCLQHCKDPHYKHIQTFFLILWDIGIQVSSLYLLCNTSCLTKRSSLHTSVIKKYTYNEYLYDVHAWPENKDFFQSTPFLCQDPFGHDIFHLHLFGIQNISMMLSNIEIPEKGTKLILTSWCWISK